MNNRTLNAFVRMLVAGAAALALAGCGLTAPRGNDGYADLDSLGMFDTDRVFALSLGPTVLGFAARMCDEDDPETAALLRGLDGVRIRVYEIDGDLERVTHRAARMAERLEADDWERVMLVREADEEMHLLMRIADGRVLGLTLIAIDGASEAVVINLMGELDPSHFGDVMVALDVDAPDVRVASVN